MWQGKEYHVDCGITTYIEELYLAGNISVGDYVLVEFLDERVDRAVVFDKIEETWE